MTKVINLVCLILVVLILNTGLSTSGFSVQRREVENTIVAASWGPEINFFAENNFQAVGFEIQNCLGFEKLSYQIFYEFSQGERQIAGEIDLLEQETVARHDLVLGSCSGETCIYDEGIAQVKLKLDLFNPDGSSLIIERLLNF